MPGLAEGAETTSCRDHERGETASIRVSDHRELSATGRPSEERGMDCLDCNLAERAVRAVAVCRDCGAGACLDHAVVRQRWLPRTGAMVGSDPVEPPARLLRCLVCDAAVTEAGRGPGRARRRAASSVSRVDSRR